MKTDVSTQLLRSTTLIVLMVGVGLVTGSLIAPRTLFAAKPTAESVLAADEALANALRDNDGNKISQMLDNDWAVISAVGGVGEGKSIFPDAIKGNYLTHNAYEVSDPRVRLSGNVAWVTTKVHNVGTSGGKPFDVMERVTDIWLWKDNTWKCVLSHESWEGRESNQKQLAR